VHAQYDALFAILVAGKVHSYFEARSEGRVLLCHAAYHTNMIVPGQQLRGNIGHCPTAHAYTIAEQKATPGSAARQFGLFHDHALLLCFELQQQRAVTTAATQ
jgi:hypothetical protein